MNAARLTSIEQAVTTILDTIPGEIRLGVPLGLGKPNPFVNALYRRVKQDGVRRLHIFTALSLNKPQASSDLEARFLDPFVQRVFGDYPDLDYVADLKNGTLPPNITVNEFFLKSGDWLHNATAQQNYINSNYTHIARDMAGNGVNVLAQAVAAREDGGELRLSLACNPDLTLDMLDLLQPRRDAGEAIFAVGMINRNMPFMGNDAEISPHLLDLVIDDPAGTHTLFSTPNMKVTLTDYAIGIHTSSLVSDGGTLQIGIGSLGDAIAHALITRQHDNPTYTAMVRKLNYNLTLHPLQDTTPFLQGLYGCSEMFVNGFLKLIQGGVVKRPVYGHAGLQRLINRGLLTDKVTPHTLRILAEHGLIGRCLDGDDVAFLIRYGIFREHCSFEDGTLYAGEIAIGNDLDDSDVLQGIIAHCLGAQLTGGMIMHGGFFLGPRDFYDTLRAMPEAEKQRICMSTIAFINHLYADRHGDEALKRAQRAKARFINTCMMTTLAGAHVSDGLENGTVVSGVGGQYNFVAQGHELPDARSILMMRSHRMVDGEVKSNIVPSYGHITIPRHLRDMLVTEYGIADLRGKNDSDIIKALLNVADSRCQDELREWAVSNGKLSADYIIPRIFRENTPEALAARLEPFQKSLPAFPFGTDFTKDELAIIKALTALKASRDNPLSLVKTVISAVFSEHEVPQRYLERMGFDEVHGLKDRFMRRLFMGNF